ncbi:MAG: TonB-dependent receptor plug domain-containing protein [Cellvibrionaceae bacterium]
MLASEQRFDFDTPVQPLKQSLIEFGELTEKSLIYSTSMVEYKMGNRVQGKYTLDDALTGLLKDSNIFFSRGDSGIYTLYHQPQAYNFLSRFFSRFQQSKAAHNQNTSFNDIEEIVTVGSRSHSRHAKDLTVPVDVFSATDLEQSHHLELGRKIQSLAPSFTFPISTQSDGTDAFRPSTLRGLAPDQLLILVNGKRRHQSALLHTSNTVGRGTTGTDFNAIANNAIKSVEVLRDGAAALYGSDAIAGVINIQLKDSPDATNISVHRGQTSEGDGETTQLSLNHGQSIFETGFINVSFNQQDRQPTNRANLNADCIYANSCVRLNDDTVQTSDTRERSADRDNYRVGDSDYQQWSSAVSFGIPFSDSIEVYGNLLWSQQDHITAGFFRSANNPESNPTRRFNGDLLNAGNAYRENGFLPLINTLSEDMSISLGIESKGNQTWQWDMSLNYGANDFEYQIEDSLNASLVSLTGNSPSSAYAGHLFHSLLTWDLDLLHHTSWGSLALGATLRRDAYDIQRGDELSYRDYDTVNGISLGSYDASRGIQVFPGYTPDNEINTHRNSQAFYINAEWDITEKLQSAAAVRYENFDELGDNVTFKVSSSYQLTPSTRIRSGLNTGFRAPSLQQQFYSDISNQFVLLNDQLQQVRVATINHRQSQALGLNTRPLQEEYSVNANLGLVYSPSTQWFNSIDFYHIEIRDRIVISDIMPAGLNSELDQYLNEIGANASHAFFNGVDTHTQGVDVYSEYNTPLGNAHVQLSFSANYTKTEIDDFHAFSTHSDFLMAQNRSFSSQSESIIEEWQPHWRTIVSASAFWQDWELNLSAESFGSYTVEESNGDRQKYGAKTLINADLNYRFSSGLTLSLGVNNLFNEVPDKNNIGQTGQGKIVDTDMALIAQSPGVFQYSRRTTPFGFNGAYYYLTLSQRWD